MNKKNHNNKETKPPIKNSIGGFVKSFEEAPEDWIEEIVYKTVDKKVYEIYPNYKLIKEQLAQKIRWYKFRPATKAKKVKIQKNILPNKMTKANSFEIFEETFWIVKKNTNGASSPLYHAYNIDTLNHICKAFNKSTIFLMLEANYMNIIQHDF